jgi:hypothetical protein
LGIIGKLGVIVKKMCTKYGKKMLEFYEKMQKSAKECKGSVLKRIIVH